MRFLLPVLYCLLVLLWAGCTKDVLPEPEETDCLSETAPVYVDEIQPIIAESCAYSGCHLGGAPGLYDSYEGLLPSLESGEFRNRVIDLRTDPTRGMPPAYAPPGRPMTLTADELQLISCWLEAGHPLE